MKFTAFIIVLCFILSIASASCAQTSLADLVIGVFVAILF